MISGQAKICNQLVCERVEFWLKPQFRSIGIAPGGADQMPPVVASMRRKGAEWPSGRVSATKTIGALFSWHRNRVQMRAAQAGLTHRALLSVGGGSPPRQAAAVGPAPPRF